MERVVEVGFAEHLGNAAVDEELRLRRIAQHVEPGARRGFGERAEIHVRGEILLAGVRERVGVRLVPVVAHQGARRALRVDPHLLLGAGLLAALTSGVPALLAGQPFLTGRWFRLAVPLAGEIKLGTVLLFDVGVYLVVLGSVLLMVFTLSEE